MKKARATVVCLFVLGAAHLLLPVVSRADCLCYLWPIDTLDDNGTPDDETDDNLLWFAERHIEAELCWNPTAVEEPALYMDVVGWPQMCDLECSECVTLAYRSQQKQPKERRQQKRPKQTPQKKQPESFGGLREPKNPGWLPEINGPERRGVRTVYWKIVEVRPRDEDPFRAKLFIVEVDPSQAGRDQKKPLRLLAYGFEVEQGANPTLTIEPQFVNRQGTHSYQCSLGGVRFLVMRAQ